MERFNRERFYVPVESKTILKGLEFALKALGEGVPPPKRRAKTTVALIFGQGNWWRVGEGWRLTSAFKDEEHSTAIKHTELLLQLAKEADLLKEEPAEENPVLLISEDGVSLKTGDRIYIVNKGDNNVWSYNNRSPYYNISIYNQSVKKDEYKAFSTEEAARKFVAEQSVTVTIAEGVKVIISADSWDFSEDIHGLTKGELNNILEIYNSLQPF